MTELIPIGGASGAIEQLEIEGLKLPQTVLPVNHVFGEGTYIRWGVFPVGFYAIGHEHKKDHINIVPRGKFRIIAGDSVIEMSAENGPLIFTAEAGVRKAAYFLEETVFMNVLHNPTDERDIDKLEDIFIVKSPAFLRHELEQAEIKQLTESVAGLPK